MNTTHTMRRSGFTLIELVISLSVIGLLLSILLPAVQTAREASRKVSCTNNLRQIGIAMHQYEEVHRRWPTNVAMPWTAAMGPFVENNYVMREWDSDFDAYESDGNANLARQTWTMYSCPSAVQTRDAESTWPLSHYSINPELTFEGNTLVPDGRSNTAVVAELSSELALPWADGPAITVEASSSDHSSTFGILFGDGRVQQLEIHIDFAVLKGIGTPDGGEIVDF